MARKRRKMNWFDFKTRCLCFYDFEDILHKPSGTRGTIYHMTAPLSEADKKFILSWDNTLVTSCSYRYAPTMKHDCIFIGNKCIRGN